MRLLVQQLAETDAPQEVVMPSEKASERIQSLETKVKLLEKDLFYYKKTSRDLKKRLQSQPGVVKGRDDGGREMKDKLASRGSERHVHDQATTASEGVADSLQLESENSLTISGTSLTAKTQSHVASSSDNGVSRAPPTGGSQQVIRKQKKQLRQLRLVLYVYICML